MFRYAAGNIIVEVELGIFIYRTRGFGYRYVENSKLRVSGFSPTLKWRNICQFHSCVCCQL